MKRIYYILLTMLLTGITVADLFAQREEFGSKRVGRETISREDRDTRNGDVRKAGPPGPGGGGEGDPIPVNGGLLLLMGMSTSYFLVQRKKLNSK